MYLHKLSNNLFAEGIFWFVSFLNVLLEIIEKTWKLHKFTRSKLSVTERPLPVGHQRPTVWNATTALVETDLCGANVFPLPTCVPPVAPYLWDTGGPQTVAFNTQK